MKVLICGTRKPLGFAGVRDIRNRMKQLPEDTLIIQGGAHGVDNAAKIFASTMGFSCQEFKADWKQYGKGAGPIRNAQMLDEIPDLVIAFPRGKSPGTRNCIKQAQERNIPVEVIEL